MLYREIIAVCSQIHTKHTNTLCGQNVELLNVKLAVRIVTTKPELSSEAVQPDPTPHHTRTPSSFLTVARSHSAPDRTRRFINSSLLRCDAVLFGRQRKMFRKHQLPATNQQGVTSGKL
jgi:hypothetical protein